MEIPGDPREEQEAWLTEMKEDLHDMEEENEESYEHEMAKFRGKMKKWNDRRKKKKKTDMDESDDDDSSITQRPKPPQKPDSEELKRILEKRLEWRLC
jgi:hypothetical protein